MTKSELPVTFVTKQLNPTERRVGERSNDENFNIGSVSDISEMNLQMRIIVTLIKLLGLGARGLTVTQFLINFFFIILHKRGWK